MAGIDSKFDKAYAGKSVEELADAPGRGTQRRKRFGRRTFEGSVQHQDRPRPRNEQVLPVAQATAKLAE